MRDFFYLRVCVRVLVFLRVCVRVLVFVCVGVCLSLCVFFLCACVLVR